MLARWLLRLVALDSKAAGGYCWLLFVVDKHLVIDWNMSVTQNSFLLCRIAASKITISSRAHECVRWLARERILPTASWPRRPGLCWRTTINRWRRIKGGTNINKQWCLPGLMWGPLIFCQKARSGFCPCHFHTNCLSCYFAHLFLVLRHSCFNYVLFLIN